MGPLTGVATAALVGGVKFFYQAAEVLSAWCARRRARPSSTRSGCTRAMWTVVVR